MVLRLVEHHQIARRQRRILQHRSLPRVVLVEFRVVGRVALSERDRRRHHRIRRIACSEREASQVEGLQRDRSRDSGRDVARSEDEIRARTWRRRNDRRVLVGKSGHARGIIQRQVRADRDGDALRRGASSCDEHNERDASDRKDRSPARDQRHLKAGRKGRPSQQRGRLI